jgi:methyl-accepting chemotaxis protein
LISQVFVSAADEAHQGDRRRADAAAAMLPELRDRVINRLKLSGKIVGTIVIVLACASVLSFLITQRRINQQAEDAFRDKIRQITGMASTTREWLSDNLETLVPDRSYKDLNQVPAVAAWRVAQRYAKDNDMTFHTPSLNPRNPKNQPDDFERRALEIFQRDPARKEYSERAAVNGKEMMRYAQPIRLTQDCLVCHGDPAGQKGPFGWAKEGMKAGDLRGAFSVAASTAGLTQTASSNSVAIFLLSLFTLVASSSAVYFVVRKLVVHPLSRSVELANRIANNDLSSDDLVVASDDEIGDATAALNTMKNNLRKIVHSIASTAESVAAASEQISATAAVQSQAAETQRNQVVQIATAMQQMTSTVVEVSDNSNRAAGVAHQSAEMAHRGGAIVENTLNTMNVISNAVSSTGKRVDELGKRSNEIGRIAAVIDEIADQTNLLALNAAIEAARAGEQGRGFAVVADEVRKLAERTTTATTEIARMIEAIQTETNSAVLAMEEGTRQVKEGVNATHQAGDALKQIIGKSEEVGDMITMIATATTEQSSTTEEVKNSMEQISRLVESSAIGTQQSAKACEDLSTLTTTLQNLVERFRLGREQVRTGEQPMPTSLQPAAPRDVWKQVEEAEPIPRDWVQ